MLIVLKHRTRERQTKNVRGQPIGNKTFGVGFNLGLNVNMGLGLGLGLA